MNIAKKLMVSLLFMSATCAHAFNFSFLDQSAAANLTAADWKIISTTADNVLNHTRDDARVNWKNPRTGAFGYFIPSASSRQNGQYCRNLTMFNNARGYTNNATYRFCKINGEWKTA